MEIIIGATIVLGILAKCIEFKLDNHMELSDDGVVSNKNAEYITISQEHAISSLPE